MTGRSLAQRISAPKPLEKHGSNPRVTVGHSSDQPYILRRFRIAAVPKDTKPKWQQQHAADQRWSGQCDPVTLRTGRKSRAYCEKWLGAIQQPSNMKSVSRSHITQSPNAVLKQYALVAPSYRNVATSWPRLFRWAFNSEALPRAGIHLKIACKRGRGMAPSRRDGARRHQAPSQGKTAETCCAPPCESEPTSSIGRRCP